MIVLAAKRNVKKKTDDLIDVWEPPLHNIGKVKVIYRYNMSYGKEEHFEIERYKTLIIRPTIKYEGKECRFSDLFINDVRSTPTPMLFLDENVSTVDINYVVYDSLEFGAVIDENISGGISFENYLPQLGIGVFNYKSIPRGIFYAGVIFEGIQVEERVFAFPVDLDKKEFKVELNSVLFTLRLNRSKKIKIGNFRVCFFDTIKAEFGEGLLAPFSESFVELKPKGA